MIKRLQVLKKFFFSWCLAIISCYKYMTQFVIVYYCDSQYICGFTYKD